MRVRDISVNHASFAEEAVLSNPQMSMKGVEDGRWGEGDYSGRGEGVALACGGGFSLRCELIPTLGYPAAPRSVSGRRAEDERRDEPRRALGGCQCSAGGPTPVPYQGGDPLTQESASGPVRAAALQVVELRAVGFDVHEIHSSVQPRDRNSGHDGTSKMLLLPRTGRHAERFDQWPSAASTDSLASLGRILLTCVACRGISSPCD